MATRRKRAGRQRPGRAKALAAQIRRDRGYTYPEWDLASRLDPAFMKAYNGLYRRSLGMSHALPLKYRELVASAVLAYRGEERSLILHLRRARTLGATEAEMLDAFEATVMPGGALTLLRGLRALLRLRAERRRRP
ncbi:MAG TPA: carboxymuconolactone decarboxylase family protein [Candidatus Methylomirabilis sp.]|nr:carboxymuconolactone decarboxylase family protein [Candidatus Methylomirabilis sp.]